MSQDKKEKEIMNKDFQIVPVASNEVEFIINLIKRNLDHFEEAGSVLAASFRRLDNFEEIYFAEGSRYLVLKENQNQSCVGGAGIGPMAGLPPSEGIGEIRELVIGSDWRRRGWGTKLIEECLQVANELGYQRLYLETTPQMINAQKLFKRFGFKPVEDKSTDKPKDPGHLPCYFMKQTTL
ncbi:MAG: hypothetical protein CMP10_02000 [Zetaproteobacteria bacterium]|nr:hypothetical protein [Pseudobdellovibrionaceae bacterium]